MTIDIVSLDWETHSIQHHPAFSGENVGEITLILAMDCVYNEALVPPFIETCREICELAYNSRKPSNEKCSGYDTEQTLVLIGIDLRHQDVLECFLLHFVRAFKVWRVSDSHLSEELKTRVDGESEELGSGYAIFCGVLREDEDDIKKK